MSSIDERVVQMKFDSGSFENGAGRTIGMLDKLKAALKLPGATKGFNDVDAAAKKFSLAGMAEGLSGLAGKFSAMGVIGMSVLNNLTTRALDSGIRIAKSLSLDNITDGFGEYELKMGSIQTILANTARYGTKLPEVTANLDELNKYADKTIYNFGDMTKNIGLFTNAGIKIGDATAMIKGFSNTAAASGTSAQGAAGAAYQLSQALSTGTIRLMDWKSLTNVGMGNKNMQTSLVELADSMGVLEKKGVTSKEVLSNFNGSLEKEWLSAEVMANYLKIQAGELSDAQMKTLGLSAKQIAQFKEQAKTAEDAATKVRTWTQLIGTIKEGIGSGWAETFDIILGDFNQATDLFTGLNNRIGPIFDKMSKTRNDLLSGWAKLGGRDLLVNTLFKAFDNLMGIMAPIKNAFRDIFPPMTAQRLFEITQSIAKFVDKLKMGEGTALKVRRVFQGLFAALDIGWMVLKAGLKMLGDLFGSLTKGSGGFLTFAANIGDWVTGLRHAIKYGDGLTTFFAGLTRVLQVPIELIKALAKAIVNLFSGNTGANVMSATFGRVGERVEALSNVFGGLTKAWKKFISFIEPVTTAVGKAFGALGDALGKAFSTGNFSGVLDAVNSGLFAGLLVLLRKFLKDGVSISADIGGGVFGSISKSFGSLTGTLEAMQTKLKADILLKIALAIGVLTLSVVALSMIDSGKLTVALTGMAVMFGQLVAAMVIIEKLSTTGGALRLPFIATGLLLLAGALLVLSAAVKIMSTMSWSELLKGLVGMTVALGALAGVTQLLAKNSAGMISTGIGLAAIAVAVKLLASATKDFAEMDWGSMIKGLTGVGAALVALAIFTRLADLSKMSLSSGAGLLLLGVSLKVIASAVKDFGGMDWMTLGKGLAAMAVSLGLIAIAMNVMPKNMLVTGAALVMVAGALVLLSAVLKTMGGMTWDEIARGLVVLAGSLVIIAAAMYLMTGALPGAAALIVIAGALAILTPVLFALGSMTWAQLGMGLTVLAAALTLIGVAGLLLTPVIPSLLGLGVAILLLGVGTLAAGAGLLAFSAGLTALAAAGSAGAAALTNIAKAIIGLIPMALKAVGEGLVLLAQVIARSGPSFTAAMTTLMLALLKAIRTVVPQIISTILNLIVTLLNTIASNVGRFITAGVNIIVGFLNGIAQNIGRVVTSAVNVVTSFLTAIGNNLGRVIQAGVTLILKFINGITTAINSNSSAVGAAGGRLAMAIVTGMVKGIAGGIGAVASAARNLASNALSAAMSFLGINSPSKEFMKIGRYSSEGMAVGLERYSGVAAKAAEGVGHDTINAMRKSLGDVGAIISGDVDLHPVIAPVLDLSHIQKNAGKIGTMLNGNAVAVGSTYSQASNVATAQRSSSASAVTVAAPSQPGITFVQNNNSPKALSSAEIYRQTKNQLSIAKGALSR